MEENIRDIREESKATRDEMRVWFKEIIARFDGLDNKYVSIELYKEEKEKVKNLEKKVEGINMKIASWSGSIIILGYIAQQLIDKWK